MTGRWLSRHCAGGLAFLLLTAGCAAAPPAEQTALVGAWRSSVQFETGAFAGTKNLEFLYVFNEGGTMTESSNYDAAPPVPPAYGVWRPVGANTFETKYEFFTTTPSPSDVFKNGGGWLPSGRGLLTERITLAADGRTFTSAVKCEMFGLGGEPVEGSGDAKGRAERIRF